MVRIHSVPLSLALCRCVCCLLGVRISARAQSDASFTGPQRAADRAAFEPERKSTAAHMRLSRRRAQSAAGKSQAFTQMKLICAHTLRIAIRIMRANQPKSLSNREQRAPPQRAQRREQLEPFKLSENKSRKKEIRASEIGAILKAAAHCYQFDHFHLQSISLSLRLTFAAALARWLAGCMSEAKCKVIIVTAHKDGLAF